jgi:hypothetical protein
MARFYRTGWRIRSNLPGLNIRSILGPMASDPVSDRSFETMSRAIRPVTLAHEQVVPVLPALASVVPGGGLARGSVVVVAGDRGATSLALALAAGPSRAGGWTAMVGCGDLGLAAAEGMGVALERLALVSEPSPGEWAGVVAALIGAVDVVVMSPAHRVRTGDARRLAARARERGTVLVQIPTGRGTDRRGVDAGLEADLRLTVIEARWRGLGHGHGHLQTRRLTVETGGRRRAARSRRFELWCPDASGEIALVAAPVSAGRHHEDVSATAADVDLKVG